MVRSDAIVSRAAVSARMTVLVGGRAGLCRPAGSEYPERCGDVAAGGRAACRISTCSLFIVACWSYYAYAQISDIRPWRFLPDALQIAGLVVILGVVIYVHRHVG
jgi:hypothetical protein